MNNDDIRHKINVRNQTLILVEGDHEKSVVLWMFLRCFPDMNIPYENVHVYGGKIYDLFDSIEDEYGDTVWDSNGEEIDIPYLISKREEIMPPLDKRNYSNILLIFDYECQDVKFSAEKIDKMQRHFCSPTDDGILYINYPMIEAYKDMSEIPDVEYHKKKYVELGEPGIIYKNKVKDISVLAKYIGVYDRLVQYCRKCHVSDDKCNNVVDKLLALKNDDNLGEALIRLEDFSDNVKDNMLHYVCSLLKKYVPPDMSYWERLRELLIVVASQNISKGYMLQQRNDDIQPVKRQMYEELNFSEILSVQNSCSCKLSSNFVWVLSTCMCILGEYKFFWKNSRE